MVRINQPANATIGLYNLNGRLVRTFADNKQLAAGTYQYPVNASGLEPGIYICRMNINGQSFTRKVLVQ
jgi:hypothetical protein